MNYKRLINSEPVHGWHSSEMRTLTKTGLVGTEMLEGTSEATADRRSGKMRNAKMWPLTSAVRTKVLSTFPGGGLRKKHDRSKRDTQNPRAAEAKEGEN